MDIYVVMKLRHKVFADYWMPEGHTSRLRSNKQYGALSARTEYSRKIKNNIVQKVRVYS
jgi:hypothetical protein